MNKWLLRIRKILAWGNPLELEELNENPNQSFWESYGWRRNDEV